MRNIQTREGYEFWDKICAVERYGFLFSPDGKRIVKTPGIGSWIDMYEAQKIVDQAQSEINALITALKLIEHATSPTHEDGAHHENAHSLATQALSEFMK